MYYDFVTYHDGILGFKYVIIFENSKTTTFKSMNKNFSEWLLIKRENSPKNTIKSETICISNGHKKWGQCLFFSSK